MKPVALNVGSTQFSHDTENILTEICAASHLSGARSRHLFNYLNDCQTIKKTKDHIHYEDLISSKVGARCARSTYAGGPKGK